MLERQREPPEHTLTLIALFTDSPVAPSENKCILNFVDFVLWLKWISKSMSVFLVDVIILAIASGYFSTLQSVAEYGLSIEF